MVAHFIYNALSKTTGISPIEYIQQFRIVKAAEQLLQTNQSIKEISNAVGIETQNISQLYSKENRIYAYCISKKNEMKEGYNNEFLQK